MIRLVRVMRILRIFKLVRHFAGLQSLFYTLQQAYQELGLLLVIIAVAILTYSSLVYFTEKEVPDGYDCSDWTKGERQKNIEEAYAQLLDLFEAAKPPTIFFLSPSPLKNVSGQHWTAKINHPCYVWTFVESFWWTLMTITTVGYELNPKSFLGNNKK